MQYPDLGWKRTTTQFPYAFQLGDPSGISIAIPLQWTWELRRVRRQCWQTTLPSKRERWHVHKYTCHGERLWWEWRTCSFNQCWHIVNNGTFTFMKVFVLWKVSVLHSTQGWWLYCHGQVSFRLNTNGTGFFTCKECRKAFEIIPLQTSRKQKNWKTEETLERAAVTPDTERVKGSNFFYVYDNDDYGGNSLTSFFNHNQQQISCCVHGSNIVNYHNAVAEDIPFIWQKIERKPT